jgi:hypothetical protein
MSANKIAVYIYGAFSPASDGCHARVCSLLDRLTEIGERVAVYSYDNHPDFPWRSANVDAFRARWPGVELVLERYSGKLKLATRVKNLLVSLFPKSAARLIRISIPGWSPKFDRLKTESSFFLVNYTHGLCQLNGVDPGRCLVDTHDVNFAKWAKITNSNSISVTSLRKLRGEIATLEVAGTVIAISPPEAAFFRMMLSRDNISYVSSWTEPCTAMSSRNTVRDIDLVFFGSGYIMNARGFCEMLEKHGAWLRRYRIVACGLVCEDTAVIELTRRFPNVTLLGFVAEPGEIYARSKAALSPVGGTGLKMKIVAAVEAGIPVFASRQSLDGLPPGFEEAVFPISEAGVTVLLDNEDRLSAARAAARRYAATFAKAGDVAAVLDRLKAGVVADAELGQPSDTAAATPINLRAVEPQAGDLAPVP